MLRLLFAGAGLSTVPSSAQTLTDLDGNTYATVRIGGQLWMAENLRTSRYADGTPIWNIKGQQDWDGVEWGDGVDWGAWSSYGNNAARGVAYGYLYNWHAVGNPRGLCPAGWRVPSDADWDELTAFLGGEHVAGGKMKTTGTWYSPNNGASNSSGFSALPAGSRASGAGFSDLGRRAYFWSSTAPIESGGLFSRREARYRWITNQYSTLYAALGDKTLGMSVRCIANAQRPMLSQPTLEPTSAADALVTAQLTRADEGGIVRMGVVWGEKEGPALGSNDGFAEADSPGLGSFTLAIGGLTPGDSIHVRAFAVDADGGVAYGAPTLYRVPDGVVTDVDGNVYPTVVIGDQLWMARNLRTTRFRDGTAIANVADGTEWSQADQPAWSGYWNDDSSAWLYGYLYNRFAIRDPRGLCPEGWRVPTGAPLNESDWGRLVGALGGESAAGGHVKAVGTWEQGTGLWLEPNVGATDKARFHALPTGYRLESGTFDSFGKAARYWAGRGDTDVIYNLARLIGFFATSLERGSYSEQTGLSVRCVRDYRPFTLSDVAFNTLGATSAGGSAEVLGDAGSPVVRRGAVWGVLSDPTLEDNLGATDDSTPDTGAFSFAMTGLSPSTTYHVRAFAITQSVSETDTAYSAPATFTTLGAGDAGTLTDVDGNTYATVRIGGQLWMAENLRTTRYADSAEIANVTGTAEWSSLTTGAWADYQNSQAEGTRYGALYNGHAVAGAGGLCPAGWHVPTDAEWDALVAHLGGESTAGGALKTFGTTDWRSPNAGATNASGFAALPGGVRLAGGGEGDFALAGEQAYFWSSSAYASGTAWYRRLAYDDAQVVRGYYDATFGMSVRCVWDTRPLAAAPPRMSEITSTSASAGSSVLGDGGVEVVRRGVVWGTSPDPTLDANTGSAEAPSGGSGAFTVPLADLAPSTLYHVRAFAVNARQETAYSASASFTTRCAACAADEPVTDLDGNTYATVRIGEQRWMAENLRTTRYADGTEIPHAASNGQWEAAGGGSGTGFGQWRSGVSFGARADYENDPSSREVYGLLYNGHAAASERGLCPEGWRVPQDADWNVLAAYFGGDALAGGTLKARGTEYWIAPNTGATNESGFTGLPAGVRLQDGAFGNRGGQALFWSSTPVEGDPGSAWGRSLLFVNSFFTRSAGGKGVGGSVRCIWEYDPLELADVQVSGVTSRSASLAGEVLKAGGSAVVRRGMVWGTAPDPVLGGDGVAVAEDPSPGLGGFSVEVSGLAPSTSYFARAFAVNAAQDTAYSAEARFTTRCAACAADEPVADIDGNLYATVRIGEQRWMAENLRTTRYADGTEIPDLVEAGSWASTSAGARASYVNQAPSDSVYGLLYNGYAAGSAKGLCPEGWRVPGDADWAALSQHLGGDAVAGGKLKEAGTRHWASPNAGGTDESGFSARPGGSRGADGVFAGRGYNAFFWSSTSAGSGDAWYRVLYHDGAALGRLSFRERSGFSVRCLWAYDPLEMADAQVDRVEATAASVASEVVSGGGSAVTRRGVVWAQVSDPGTDPGTGQGSGQGSGQTPHPVLGAEGVASVDASAADTGAFSVDLTGLTPSTSYILRAFAVNADPDTAYSAPVTFTTRFAMGAAQVGRIESTSAILASEVLGDGGSAVTRRGVVWAQVSGPGSELTSDPVLGADGVASVEASAAGAGAFSVNLTGLSPSTSYLARAFAVNALPDTAYSAAVRFTSRCAVCSSADSVFDADGHAYATVRIGSQFWMAENLRTTRYTDGTQIPHAADAGTWASASAGAWARYGNQAASDSVYGLLYNGHAVLSNAGLCPQGWRVPTDEDWAALAEALGGEPAAGGTMKAPGTDLWTAPNTEGRNESGFTALPGGRRGGDGGFDSAGAFAYFWGASQAGPLTLSYRYLVHASAALSRLGATLGSGHSVRCVKPIDPLALAQARVSQITPTSASATSEVVGDGGERVTRRGVVWGTAPDPVLGASGVGSDEAPAAGLGGFSVKMTGLRPSTSYHVRAFAVNAGPDTAYSAPAVFKTPCAVCGSGATLTDIDGNTYATVRIGERFWMAENLRTTRYADGSPIPGGLSDRQWESTRSGAAAVYPHSGVAGIGSEAEMAQAYGRLYNGYAVLDSRGLCPEGWQVPTREEWQALSDLLGGNNPAGGRLKSTRSGSEAHPRWNAPNTGATDEAGFSAVPAGYKIGGGFSLSLGSTAILWSSTPLSSTTLSTRNLYDSSAQLSASAETKQAGASVRCVQSAASLTFAIQTPGPQLLSLPGSGARDLAAFVDPLWTQGVAGGDTEQGPPNLYTFDGAEWVPVTDLAAADLQPGQGFLAVVYADTDFDGIDDLPVDLNAWVPQEAAAVTLPATYAQDGSPGSAGLGWNLAGNPYPAPLDLNRLDMGRPGGANPAFFSTAYVYDPVSAQWRTWSRESQSGSIAGGLLAPLQGFFVQAAQPGAVLSFDPAMRSGAQAAKTAAEASQGSAQGFAEEPAPALTLHVRLAGDGEGSGSSATLSDQAVLSFSPRGRPGADRTDAYKRTPFSTEERLLVRFAATNEPAEEPADDPAKDPKEGQDAAFGQPDPPGANSVSDIQTHTSLDIQNVPLHPAPRTSDRRFPLEIQHLAPSARPSSSLSENALKPVSTSAADPSSDPAAAMFDLRPSRVELSWSARGLRESGLSVNLFDRVTGRSTPLAGPALADSGRMELQLAASAPYPVGAEPVYRVDRAPRFELRVDYGNASTASDHDPGYAPLPARHELSPNHPNPFNPSTQIEFALPHAAHVRLDVFDAAGRRVAVLVDGIHSAGRHAVTFDAAALTSGVYLYRLTTPGYTATRSMVLVK